MYYGDFSQKDMRLPDRISYCILHEIPERYPVRRVTTTGGEPTVGGKNPDHLHANRMSLTGEPNNHPMRIYPHKHVPQGVMRTTTPAGIKEQILGS